MNSTINKAVEIFKEKFNGTKGKFRAHVSDVNGNEVDIFNEDGYYCTINIKNGRVKGIK